MFQKHRKRKISPCEHGRRKCYAKTAEEVVYAKMVCTKNDAKIVEEAVYANMKEKDDYAKTAEEFSVKSHIKQ